MILYCTPYSLSKNIGAEYNRIMQMIGPGDSACFTDGDSAYLTPDFGHIIQGYAERHPEAVLTCKTNRIHHLSKQLDGKMDEKCDVRELMTKAYERKHLTTITEIKPGEGLSGIMMLVPKNVWEKVPFVENRGVLGIDTQFRLDLHRNGIKIYIMEAVLLLHTYRLLNGAGYKNHLL